MGQNQGAEAASEPVDSVTFTVNGKVCTVQSPEIGMTLNTWLRSSERLTGTKVMCKEGGCGSCVVMVTHTDLRTGEDTHIAVNSCLFPLLCLDGCHVTTTEGLVSKDGTYHDIQKRVAQFNATQCGYCTPGFVMTMYSLLQRNSSPSREEVEQEFDGNICRCTGYRPIFDAMKTFAIDADEKLKKMVSDIEDLQVCKGDGSGCRKKGATCTHSCGRYHANGTSSELRSDVNWCQVLTPNSLAIKGTVGGTTVTWLRPSTLAELTEAVKNNSGKNIRFVVGNTSTGVFKNEGPYDVYIDTKMVPDLYQVQHTTDALVFGANLSLTALTAVFGKEASESQLFAVLVKHLYKIANVPVRNVASWTGNLMMKKMHPEFPSDIFTLFEAFSTTLLIRDCSTGHDTTHSLIGEGGFMSLDMTGKIVLSASIPIVTTTPDGVVYHPLSYKVMPRSQNAHAYVNAAFAGKIQNGKVTETPSLVFGGISNSFVHAKATEKYLLGKNVNSQDTLNGALKALEGEVKPVSYSAADTSAKYRTSVTLGLFYKFYLTLCDMLTPDVITASFDLERPVTSATQSYGTDSSMYPVTEPMPKITAVKQASGEAKYITDFSALSDELFVTFVTSTVANADIDTIDSQAASGLPGFVAFYAASDLPSNIQNTFLQPPFAKQSILAESHVDFAGQPVAIVIADSQDHALQIANAVTVTYKNQKQGVYDTSEAISQQSFFDGAGDPVVIGDATTAIQNAPHKVSGTVNIGSQYHFYMETQVCRAKPTEDGFDIECGTQWQDEMQAALAYIFGWDCNRFNIITGRVGGAYGGKATNSMITAATATLASYLTGKPVRLHATLPQCMETYGSRSAYCAQYTVGFDSDGILKGIDTTYYSNSGVSTNDSDVTTFFIQQFADSGYHCDNWKLTPQWVRTDIASNTWCRAPVSAQLTMIMEVILEHVAKSLNADPIPTKQANLCVTGQENLFGEPLLYCSIRDISTSLLTSADVTDRQTEISSYNNTNKWKKKGLAFTPVKFGMIWNGGNYAAQVSIFHTDGSIVLSSAGVEVGQGLNTKLMQVAAYTLGAPLDLIRVKEADLVKTPNGGATGGSLTSELCCKAILESCKILKARIDGAAEQYKLSTQSWADLIAQCYNKGVNLTAQYWVFNNSEKQVRYNCYGAACSEVQVDILTGEYVLTRVDILYDCGKSINPDIDIGQVEGAFLMGVGYYTKEKMIFDETDGQLATTNTWEYKPPASKDIPTVWNVSLLKNAPNPTGVLGSKAMGEPPLCTSASVLFAIKRCVEAFRNDNYYFPIDIPATVDCVQQLCQIVTSDYTL